ncbi:MAG: type II toxin-antitoxin system RelE/ParE family toxin [Cyclobacteriaceae bacterium]|nr:type II toxin-antitoxin system RelE/ParE family toxin [Cyclobacteriaceae bacterium]
MARKVTWSIKAVLDRYQIYKFWVYNNQSETYGKKLELLFEEAANLLAMFPEVGTKTDIGGVRVKVVRSYKIFYRVLADGVVILRVWDTRQNPVELKIN